MIFARAFLFCAVSAVCLLFLIDNQLIPFALLFAIQFLLIIFPIYFEKNYPFELLTRIFLLGLPGIFTSLAFLIDPLVYRSHYLALSIQTSFTSAWLSIVCITASYGALVATFTDLQHKTKVYDPVGNQFFVSKDSAFIALSLCILFSLISTFRSGSIVFTGASYASEVYFTTPFQGVIGVLQNISASFVYLYINSSIYFRNFRIATLLSLILFITYLFPILSGQRADYMIGFLLGLYLLFKSLFRRKPIKVSFYTKLLVIPALSFVSLYFAFLLFRSIADLRSGSSGNLFIYLIDNSLKGFDLFIVNYGPYKVFFTETLNHIIGGLYSFIHKVFVQNQPYLIGSSYIDYLPRLLPEGIRPDIQGLEWKTDIDGLLVTQGAVFEGAESFYNFSLPGVFIISFLISKFLSKLRTTTRYPPWPYIIYLTLFLESFRYIWYQTFAFTRILSIFALLLLIFFCTKLFKKSRSSCG